MKTGLKLLSFDDLENLTRETEQALAELRSELERRREAQQHSEIENLEEHFADAEHKFAGVREFIEVILKELRGER